MEKKSLVSYMCCAYKRLKHAVVWSVVFSLCFTWLHDKIPHGNNKSSRWKLLTALQPCFSCWALCTLLYGRKPWLKLEQVAIRFMIMYHTSHRNGKNGILKYYSTKLTMTKVQLWSHCVFRVNFLNCYQGQTFSRIDCDTIQNRLSSDASPNSVCPLPFFLEHCKKGTLFVLTSRRKMLDNLKRVFISNSSILWPHESFFFFFTINVRCISK